MGRLSRVWRRSRRHYVAPLRPVRRPMAWLLLLAALTLSTCGRPDPARPAGTAPSALLDTEWRLAAVDGVPSVSLPGGEALVTVTFTDSDREEPWEGALGGFDGCNALGWTSDSTATRAAPKAQRSAQAA